MENQSEIRKKVEKYLESINSPEDIYDLFKKLNYPKEYILDPSYIKKLRNFSFAKDEKEKIKKIYTVITYDKLNVFLIEAKSLTKPFIRYITKVFANMYTRFLLVFTIDYDEIHIVFPDYEKKDIGKHKLKTTTLILNKKELYYTDIEIISNISLGKEKHTWRDIWRIWKEAFNVQKVTEKFFEDYKKIFFVIRKYLKKQKLDTKTAHEFTLQFLISFNEYQKSFLIDKNISSLKPIDELTGWSMTNTDKFYLEGTFLKLKLEKTEINITLRDLFPTKFNQIFTQSNRGETRLINNPIIKKTTKCHKLNQLNLI